ncbi:MAG: RidA family protein [Candidatus Micrarchaeia archaeon]|jgi:2-iminobutanoate/2-iminopropanoate deaminase
MEIKRIIGKVHGPYSNVVIVGNLVFISGQLPTNEEGQIRSMSIKEQTKDALENLKKAIEQLGLTLENVVSVRVYLTNLDDFNTMNEVFSQYFERFPPARATVIVSSLPKNAKIEIEAIATL